MGWYNIGFVYGGPGWLLSGLGFCGRVCGFCGLGDCGVFWI